MRLLLVTGLALLGLVVLIMVAGRSGEPATALARAQAYAEAGDMRTARVEALNAVQADSGDETAWLLLARTQLALGEAQAALGTVERARAAGVAAGRTRHLLAEAAFAMGDVDRALDETGQSDIDREFAAAVWRVRGRALSAAGEVEAAAQAFNAALETDPENSELWVDIARFRMTTGELAGAIAAADKAVALDVDNVEALVMRGVLTRAQYGLVAALPWFERALGIDDGDIPALLELAATLGEAGRATEMLAVTREVLESDPGNARALYLQAVLAARAREFDLARRLVELIDGRLDGQPAMDLLSAAIDFREQNYQSAIRILGRLVEAQPANRRALRLLGAAQFHSGDLSGVIATLGPLADRSDADSYMLTLVGRAWERQGAFDRAIPYLERAGNPAGGTDPIGERPRDEIALAMLEQAARQGGAPAEVALIRAYLALGRVGDALDRGQRLRDANAGAPDAHILYGDALAAAGDFGAAAAAYASAANIRFSEPVALRLVEALLRAGQPDEARRTLALYRQQNPRSVPTAMVSAQINLQAGHWRRAAAILEQLRERLGDRDAALLANLAWAWHQSGQSERAQALARRAYLLDPRNASIAGIYGWVLFDGGRLRARGIELMEKARDRTPGDAVAQWRLARAYASLGRTAQARRAAEAALASPQFAAREQAEALLSQL